MTITPYREANKEFKAILGYQAEKNGVKELHTNSIDRFCKTLEPTCALVEVMMAKTYEAVVIYWEEGDKILIDWIVQFKYFDDESLLITLEELSKETGKRIVVDSRDVNLGHLKADFIDVFVPSKDVVLEKDLSKHIEDSQCIRRFTDRGEMK